MRYQIAEAISLVLHLGRHRGARHVEELIQVERYDVGRDGYDHRVLFHGGRAPFDTSAAMTTRRDREVGFANGPRRPPRQD